LELGNKVEYLKYGMVNEGTLIEKDTYNAKIEVPENENASAVLTIPYKDIKTVIQE
jgi:hypothetical protein